MEAVGATGNLRHQFRSYRDYVASLAKDHPEFGWLNLFLAKPGANPSQISVLIADSLNNTMQLENFSSKVSECHDALQQRPIEVKTRIILVSYHQTWSIDRDIADSIGLAFDIDPTFFWAHFDHREARVDRLVLSDKA